MVCWWYGILVRFDLQYGNKHDMWYGMLVVWYMGKTRYPVWYDGMVSWMYYMAKFAKW